VIEGLFHPSRNGYTGGMSEQPALSSASPVSIVSGTSGLTQPTAVIVACALFMQNLGSTVIATALPTMGRAFGVEPVRMNVALSSYLLRLAVFIPASGWIADRYGTRTVFRAAIAVFTVGSVLCGRANTLNFLVAARVLEGIGGAMMVPVGRLVLLRTAPRHELVAAMAWLTMPSLLGPVLGPPVGGFIVTYFDWRWIFGINVPIGILGIVLVTLFIQDAREPPLGKFDFLGLALSGVALAGVMFGLETAGRGVVPSVLTEAMVGTGLLAGIGYALHAWRHPEPLLDFSLLKLPCFGVAFCAMMLFRTGIGAVPFLLPMMMQVGFGDSAVESGLITFASAAGAFVMKPAAQHALRMFGFRDTLLWNGIISGTMLALCAAFRPAWPVAAIYAVLLVGGFFRSLQFTAYNTLAYGDVPRSRMSAATSLYITGQQLAATVGVSVGALALEVAMRLSGDGAARPTDSTVAFIAVAALPLVAGPIALLMPRDAGDDLTGRRSISR
jgi:EmrB/QacA subfamily drug resistance transporter